VCVCVCVCVFMQVCEWYILVHINTQKVVYKQTATYCLQDCWDDVLSPEMSVQQRSFALKEYSDIIAHTFQRLGVYPG
jgi:hypothetical protein